MNFEPKQKNKAPEVLTGAFLFCAIVCMAFGSFESITGRGVLQTAGLAFFAAFIFVLVKYKFTRVHYCVRKITVSKGYGSEDEETVKADGNEKMEAGLPVIAYPPKMLEFVVEKAQGKRPFVTEMVVSLGDIVYCSPLPQNKQERKKIVAEAGKGNTYKYLKNMVGGEQWLMTVKTDNGRVKIFFEPNEKMGEYLRAVAAYNREQRENGE